MSGFAGIAGPISHLEHQWLDQAARFMSYRGPDGLETWEDSQQVGLAAAYLAAQPSSPGRAIGASLDGFLWICGDIRLDRKTELARMLGFPALSSIADHDLILGAYRRWGEGCLERISGDFSFLIWDKQERHLFGARDFPGVAQLYYAQAGEHWLFGNSFDAFFLHPAIADDLNEAAIGDFLVQGFNQDQATTSFTRIHRLPPGHTITWGGGSVRIRPWPRPSEPALIRLPFASDYPEEFGDLLDHAVGDRLAGGPYSIHLSGGMDSSSVAAAATGVDPSGRERIRAFTVVLGGEVDNDEETYAREVSRALGIRHEVLVADEYPLRNPLVSEFVAPAPVPYLPTRLQYDLLSRTAQAGRLALTGHGGDVVLEFRSSWWIDWLVSGKVSRLAGTVAEHFRLFGVPPQLFPRAAWTSFRTRLDPDIPHWISSSFVRRTHLRERSTTAAPLWRPHPDAGGYVGSAFWSDLFAWHDPGFTRLPLRFRHPFFDRRLSQFTRSLPPMPWLHRKRILREAMRARLPDVVRVRRKVVLERTEPGRLNIGHHPDLFELFTDKAERFLDCQRLTEACREAETTSWGMEREFMNSIGLAYWLYHWRRPELRLLPERPIVRHPSPGRPA